MATRPTLPRNVWVLGFVSLLMDLSSEVYHALMPVFVTVTLGLPVLVLGTLDGIAEATASLAKLVSGRWSDRTLRRKPWVLAGYGLAALSKPLFPVAQGPAELLAARFADRLGKGIRGAPRDALIADDTPPALRGRAFGLRQALDTLGALLAPLIAIALMILLAGNVRAVFWIAAIPASLSFLLAWLALREPAQHRPSADVQPFFAGFRAIARPTRRLLAVAFLISLARLSEGFLVLRGMEAGLSETLAPLTLVLFNLAYVALAYSAGSLSDRTSPRSIVLAGTAVLVAAAFLLSQPLGLAGLAVGVSLWGVHMALTQGVLARMVADSAPAHLRATSFGAFHFVSGIGMLLAGVGGGLLWDREGSQAAYLAAAGAAAVAFTMLSLLSDRR